MIEKNQNAKAKMNSKRHAKKRLSGLSEAYYALLADLRKPQTDPKLSVERREPVEARCSNLNVRSPPRDDEVRDALED